MSDKNLSEQTNRSVFKNPLLSTAVTGLSLEDLTHNAVLLPVRSQELVSSQESTRRRTIDNNPNIQTDTNSNTIRQIDINTNTEQQHNLNSAQEQKREDDFDFNEFFSRLHGTRYVSAPINATIKEDDSLDDTEDNLEEINLNDSQEESSITSDIAQNFSQLPQVLPHVASAVFSSFSSILSLKSREHTPDYDKKDSSSFKDFEREVVLEPNFESKPLGPPPSCNPPVGNTSNTFRITTKRKTYAQIPGLSTGHQKPGDMNITQPPLNSNVPPIYIPTEFQPTSVLNVNLFKNISGSVDLADQHNLEVELESTGDTVYEDTLHDTKAFHTGIPAEETKLLEPPDISELNTASSYKNSDQPSITEYSNIPIKETEICTFSITSNIHTQNIPPPPTISALPSRNSVGSGVNRTILPPSVARKIGSSQPVLKTTIIPSVTDVNIFVPQPFTQSVEKPDHTNIPLMPEKDTKTGPPKLYDPTALPSNEKLESVVPSINVNTQHQEPTPKIFNPESAVNLIQQKELQMPNHQSLPLNDQQNLPTSLPQLIMSPIYLNIQQEPEPIFYDPNVFPSAEIQCQPKNIPTYFHDHLGSQIWSNQQSQNVYNPLEFQNNFPTPQQGILKPPANFGHLLQEQEIKPVLERPKLRPPPNFEHLFQEEETKSLLEPPSYENLKEEATKPLLDRPKLRPPPNFEHLFQEEETKSVLEPPILRPPPHFENLLQEQATKPLLERPTLRPPPNFEHLLKEDETKPLLERSNLQPPPHFEHLFQKDETKPLLDPPNLRPPPNFEHLQEESKTKPFSEPPKLPSGVQSYRMVKKRPQYYSGPIEGIGSIGTNNKPTIPTPHDNAYLGPYFTPEFVPQDQTSENPIQELSSPVFLSSDSIMSQSSHQSNAFAVTSAQNYTSNTQQAPTYDAFDLSRATTERFEPELKRQETTRFGIIGSLKSKLSSIDITKIQDSVTTFFDHTYIDAKKAVPGFQETSNSYEHARSITDQSIDIFGPFDEHMQSQYQPYQNQPNTNIYHQQYGYNNSAIAAREFNPQSQYSQVATSWENQQNFGQQLNLTNEYNVTSVNNVYQQSYYGISYYQNIPISIGTDKVFEDVKCTQSPIIAEQALETALQEKLSIMNPPQSWKPAETIESTNLEISTPSKSLIADATDQQSQNWDQHKDVPITFEQLHSTLNTSSLPEQSENILKHVEASPDKNIFDANIKVLDNDRGNQEKTGTQTIQSKVINIGTSLESSSLPSASEKNIALFDFPSRHIEQPQAKNIVDEFHNTNEIIDYVSSDITLQTRDDFCGILDTSNNTNKNMQLFNPNVFSNENPSITTEQVATLDADPNNVINNTATNKEESFCVENMDNSNSVLADQVKGDLGKDNVSDFNICETCREVNNKPEEKDLDDLTRQLIENITSPIQLFNRVEVPFTESTTPMEDRGDFGTNECVEISHITEETMEALQVIDKEDKDNYNRNNKIKQEEKEDSINKYGWLDTERVVGNILTERDYGHETDPNTVGLCGGNLFLDNMSILTNASDEIKAGFQNSDTNATLPRQLSIPTAPPIEEFEEDSKSDITGVIDVHLIEQDASKYFPIFEEFVIEPSETDDDKIEFKERKKSTDESQLDSFTDRIEKYKQLEENNEKLSERSSEQSANVTGDVVISGSYFNMGPYGAGVISQPSHICEDLKVISPVVTFASYFDTGNYAAETHYRNSLLSSPTEILPTTCSHNIPNEPIEIKEPIDICVPERVSGREGQEFSSTTDLNLDINTVQTVTPILFNQEPVESTVLPDPISFFNTEEDSTKQQKQNNQDDSFNRLASYFASPTKTTDNSKSFFELSQSQDHFRQNPKESQESSQDGRYLANLELMRDLTSNQNVDSNFNTENIVRTVNYFTVQYDINKYMNKPKLMNETYVQNVTNSKNKPIKNRDKTKEMTENNENKVQINNKTDEIQSVLNCEYCCNDHNIQNHILGETQGVRKVMDSDDRNPSSMKDIESQLGNKDSINKKNVNVTFSDVVKEDYNDAVSMAHDNRSTTEYIPVKHHWYYRLDIEDKSVWNAFSVKDSTAIEDAFNDPGLNENTLVATDGGRFDVNIIGRIRTPVYWKDKPTNVRRCSWFYKGTTDARYVPYSEAIAEKLEVEYRHGVVTGEWHRRLALPNGEAVVMHGPAVMVHFLQSTGSDAWTSAAQSAVRPRVVRRGHDHAEIEPGESAKVDHLLLLCHGVGSACDMRFRPVVEVVDDFRTTSLQLTQAHYRNSYESGDVGRVEVLPVSWHSTLHAGEAGVDRRLALVTLDSIPRLRNFTNDTVLDVLFYTSPVFCQIIVDTVCKELNRIYDLFKLRNPSFEGRVSLGGHSLGSVILYDLLCHQNPDGLEPTPHPESNRDRPPHKHYVGPVSTGHPTIDYPVLKFSPDSLYALGSPIAIFECIRGVESLGEHFKLPTCEKFFNIFHPYDPIAYRIEPLINPKFKNIPPSVIPHHKGRKRMHLELKETMARVGADIKQKVLESIRSTWSNVFRGGNAIEEQVHRASVPTSGGDAHPLTHADTVGSLNGGRRVDLVLQEAPFETINEYLFAMAAHVGYWESEDTMLLILKEIYDSLGVSPDGRVPQGTMTVERDVTAPDDRLTRVPSELRPSSSEDFS